MSAPERFDWIWCGVDDNGDIHVSLGRWQKHPCQFRYKFAEVQPTEHDHTRAMPTALAVPEVAALVEAVEPFAKMAAEMFARNWNKQDVAIALDNPDDPHRLTFADFLALHTALAALRGEVKP